MNKREKRVVTMLMAGGTYETYWDPKTKTNKPGIQIEPNSSDERMALDLVRDGMPIKVINLYRDGKCSAKAIVSTIQERPKPRVLVTVRGGMAEAIHDEGVEVLILDYDLDMSDDTFEDANGDLCEQRATACQQPEMIEAQFANAEGR